MNADLYALRAAILLEPFGRIARHMSSGQGEFLHLARLGLFKGVGDPGDGSRWELTLKGRIAHNIAAEMHPKRGAWRTVRRLRARVAWFMDGRPPANDTQVAATVRDCLSELVRDGVIERDRDYSKDEAWRVKT